MSWSNRLGSSAPSNPQPRQMVNHRRPKPTQQAYGNQQPPRPQNQGGYRNQRPPQQRSQPQPPQRVQQARNWQAQLDQEVQANGERIAKIRGVRSGNTLRIQYHQEETENNVMLDGVRAPRLSSRMRHEEDFFAFEAKEFLRKRVIGTYARVKPITAEDRGGNGAGKFPLNLVRIKIPAMEPTKLHEGNCRDWIDLGVVLCENGYGECSVNNFSDKQEYYGNLEKAVSVAREQKKGKFNTDMTPEDMANTIRDFEDDRDGGETVLEDIFEKFKGVDIPAVIDDVIEGSTLRVELHLHSLQNSAQPIVRNVRFYCMGVQCDRVHPPRTNQEENYKRRNGSLNGFKFLQSGPVAIEAKKFMKVRLSHRDVYISVRFFDTGRLYGCIRLPNGFDPARNLLARGYAKTNWGLSDLSAQQQEEYHAAQESAQNQGFGMWKAVTGGPKPVARKRGGRGNTHLVTKVFSGDSLQLYNANEQEGPQNPKRVFLASTNCPRLAPRGRAAQRNANGARVDENGAWAAKEFTRTSLIGKEITVLPEYTRGNPGQQEREYVTVRYLDEAGQQKDLTAELIKQGYATLVKHRAEDSRASNFTKYKSLEDEARKKEAGIHDESKRLDTPQVVDYKALQNTHHQVLNFLKNLGLTHLGRRVRRDNAQKRQSSKMLATIEYVAGCSRYVVLLDQDGKLHKLSFNLSGIRSVTDRDGNQVNLQGEDELLRNRDLTDQANKIVRNMIQQKDVWITIDDINKNNGNALGQVYTEDGESITDYLLGCGFAKINERAIDYLPFGDRLKAKQQEAQVERVGIWKDWTPAPKEEEQQDVATEEAPEKQEKESAPAVEVARKPEPRQITGILGDVEDSATVWIIQKNQNKEAEIQSYMSSVDPGSVDYENFEPEKKGTKPTDANFHRVVGGLFDDGNYYRFKINKVRRKTKKGTELEFIGVFIDFGTRATLDLSKLIPIMDDNIRNYKALSKRYRLLALKAPPVVSEEFNAAGSQLYDFLAGADIDVRIMDNPKDGGVTEAELFIDGRSVNLEMLECGYCRMENKDRRRLAVLDKFAEKKAEFFNAFNKAAASHKGMFRHGAVDSGDEEEDTGRRKRKNRRRRD